MRPFRLDVEDALTARGWSPVERILGRRVNVFWSHPEVKSRSGEVASLGLSAAVAAQCRMEERR